MKVAYIFSSQNSHMILDKMIVPQLLNDKHGAEVVGMMFFADNTFLLTKGSSVGDRLAKVLESKKILLMACNICAIERGIDDKLIDGACIGCFPDLYKALEGSGVEQVITL
ncbi:DsrE-related protein SaoD [Brachyspira innocens]|uniref:DsrE-related protein SaoD n=1 Tax=Brachyspira innocens TaxID=13264 RepID=A0ABT8YXV7_9SPIR|nr:DsrE-related protein SaoD [Brachyspira innocens]MDO6994596.1 DsrE-related protein SaoD [Brachyspira innocens]MDO7020072.1 DsrE-related protein SaoD [Brachyspira innocens]